MSTDLERRVREVSVTEYAGGDELWDAKQIALIARTVAKGASGEELRLFLAQAAQHNLNPLSGEIWCVKTRGRNGEEGRIAIIVGEQGRLKIANRHDDYRGFRSDVICANDRFLKLSEPKAIPGVVEQFTYVEHSYGHPNERGEIVGGWCEVYRDGRPATFFYAPLVEYAPDPNKVSDKARDFIPWFKTESRMIVKCSISTAFRMAFNLAGIYGPEEMEHIQRVEAGEARDVEAEIAWGDEEETAERMRSLFAAANNTVKGSYPPAKIRLLLAGKSDEERYALAAKEIIPFIRDHGGTEPEPGEIVVDDAEVEVQDEEGTTISRDEPGSEPPDAEQETIPGTA